MEFKKKSGHTFFLSIEMEYEKKSGRIFCLSIEIKFEIKVWAYVFPEHINGI